MWAALAGVSAGFTARVRQIRVVDAMLAHYARRHSVAELEVLAHRIVQELNRSSRPGRTSGATCTCPNCRTGNGAAGSACGPAQGLLLKRALAAFSAPRPGKAIDADGVEHAIPDTRDLGARQMDAVTDIVTLALAKTGITLPADPSTADQRRHRRRRRRRRRRRQPRQQRPGQW